MPTAVIPQVCPHCKFRTEQWSNDCPRCGKVIVSPKRVRTLGWLLIVIGAFLSVGIAGVAVAIAGVIAGAGDPNTTTTLTGEQIGMMFSLFVLVFLFGVLSMALGGWQVKTGKQNPRFAFIGVMFFMAFLGMVAYMQIAW